MSDIIPIANVPAIPTGAYPKMSIAGSIANKHAAENAFTRYQLNLSANTLSRHLEDLMVFVQFLVEAQIETDASTPEEIKESAKILRRNPGSWHGVTYGLVEAFIEWQLQKGYAIGSVNVRLSTVKCYCKIAAKAGITASTEYALIKLVVGYRQKEGRNVDEKREVTRRGPKKAQPVFLTNEQVKQLKQQPDSPQGRRDTLLICLLVDHGLRCGEIADLAVSAINQSEGTITFYRKKVDKTQTHSMTKDTQLAMFRYLETCTPSSDHLLIGSNRGGNMSGYMSARAITKRFRHLCGAIGIDGASAHDGRHTWATRAASAGTQLKTLQDAGGWTSIAMPMRYVESQKIANEGVKLD